MEKHSEHPKHHILPLRTYLTVGAMLLVLTAVTVWAAQFHFGPYNLLIAMIIAATKALLVAFVFMHLWYDNKLYFTVFASSILFLAAFIVITMFDTLRRDDIYEITGKQISPRAIIYQDKASAAADTTASADTTAVTTKAAP